MSCCFFSLFFASKRITSKIWSSVNNILTAKWKNKKIKTTSMATIASETILHNSTAITKAKQSKKKTNNSYDKQKHSPAAIATTDDGAKNCSMQCTRIRAYGKQRESSGVNFWRVKQQYSKVLLLLLFMGFYTWCCREVFSFVATSMRLSCAMAKRSGVDDQSEQW